MKSLFNFIFSNFSNIFKKILFNNYLVLISGKITTQNSFMNNMILVTVLSFLLIFKINTLFKLNLNFYSFLIIIFIQVCFFKYILSFYLKTIINSYIFNSILFCSLFLKEKFCMFIDGIILIFKKGEWNYYQIFLYPSLIFYIFYLILYYNYIDSFFFVLYLSLFIRTIYKLFEIQILFSKNNVNQYKKLLNLNKVLDFQTIRKGLYIQNTSFKKNIELYHIQKRHMSPLPSGLFGEGLKEMLFTKKVVIALEAGLLLVGAGTIWNQQEANRISKEQAADKKKEIHFNALKIQIEQSNKLREETNKLREETRVMQERLIDLKKNSADNQDMINFLEGNIQENRKLTINLQRTFENDFPTIPKAFSVLEESFYFSLKPIFNIIF